MQEIYTALIMYNYCTHIIDAAEVPEKEQAVYAYQVNFQMAVYLCKRFYRRILSSGHDLIIEISRYIEPIRPGWQDQRKLRPKGFAGNGKMEYILHHGIKFLGDWIVLVVVDAALSKNIGDLLPNTALAGTDGANPLQQLTEVVRSPRCGSEWPGEN